jgi:hypothetical protein
MIHVNGVMVNNSIQFSSLLFMCRVNSHKANYRLSTVQIYNNINNNNNNNNNNDYCIALGRRIGCASQKQMSRSTVRRNRRRRQSSGSEDSDISDGENSKIGESTDYFCVRSRFSRWWLCRMPSSGMLGSVALVRTDDSEERIASIIRVTRIGELGTLSITALCISC